MPTFHGLLKRTGLNTLLRGVVPFVGSAQGQDKLMDESAATKVLHDYYPDQGSSALLPRRREMGEEQYDVAVIVPCYKAENTIRKCLDSCLNQKSAASINVIAVDDGSPDKTGAILDEYAARYKNVCAIHQENGGASVARNAALEQARGKYLTFLDADDFLPQGAIESMWREAEKEGVDIVQGSYNIVNNSGRVLRKKMTTGGVINPIKDLGGVPWGRLYRSKCFEKVRFPEHYRYEDSVNRQLVHALVAAEGGKVRGVTQSVYCSWRGNPQNATNGDIGRPCSLDSFYVTKSLYKDRLLLGLPNDQDYYEYILHMATLCINRARTAPENVKKALFVAFRRFVADNFSEFNSTNAANKYMEKALRQGNYRQYLFVSKWL